MASTMDLVTSRPYATLAVISILVYANARLCDFVFDDVSAIKDNRDLRSTTPWIDLMYNDFWGTPMDAERSHKSYRPLTVASFRLNYLIAELEPYGYHVINVFLHTFVCLAMYYVLTTTVSNRTPVVAFFSACLFAAHPVHSEAVTGVVGRAELLASFFYLAAFYAYYRMSEEEDPDDAVLPTDSPSSSIAATTTLTTVTLHLLFSLFLLLAMLSKEQGITVAGLCVAYELLVRLRVNLETATSWLSRLGGKNRRRAVPFSPKSSMADGVDDDGVSSSIVDSSSSRPNREEKTLRRESFFSPPNKRSLSILCHVVIFAALLLWLRLKIMGEGPPVFTSFDNPASTSATPTRQLTYNYLLPLNAWLLLCPWELCCDWTMGTVPLVTEVSDPRNVATLAFYVLYASLAFRVVCPSSYSSSSSPSPTRLFPSSGDVHYPAVVFGFLTLTLPFLPASNLLFPVGFVVAERVLYLPSMGFAVLVAVGAHKIHLAWTKRLRGRPEETPSSAKTPDGGVRSVLVPSVCLCLLLAHAFKLYARNADWIDEKRLFLSGLKITRKNAKIFNNVGHALEGENDFVSALRFFEMAVHAQPDDIGAHMNVGRTYNALGDLAAAEASFWKAKSLLPASKGKRRKKSGDVGGEGGEGDDGEASYVTRIAPQHLKVFVNLGNIMAKDPTRYEEADLLYREAIRMRGDFKEAYINRGDILFKLNRVDEALAMYEDALRIDPRDSDVLFNIGVVRLEKFDDKRAAFKMFEKAIESNPDHALALFNSAVMMQESGMPEVRLEAERRLLKILTQTRRRRVNGSSSATMTLATEPPEEKVYFNLGMLAMDAKNDSLAESYFRQAISLKPDFRSALFNLALMLTSGAETKAGVMARGGGGGKGNVVVASSKDVFLPAVEAAENLLSHHPDHVKGLVLMGDLQINRMRNLSYAEYCFSRAFELEPTNDQALHNLCVVHVERGLLDEAKTCLERVLMMAPKVDYVKTHLQIVKSRIAKRNQARNAGGAV